MRYKPFQLIASKEDCKRRLHCPVVVRTTRFTRQHEGARRPVLQRADDAEQILGLRIATRAEHADQAFGRRAEYRINFGPGYRVYFGQDGHALVILLTGTLEKLPCSDRIMARVTFARATASKSASQPANG